jgi:ankyrin repeat protein
MKYFKIFILILAFGLTLTSCEKAVDSKLRKGIERKDIAMIKEAVLNGANYQLKNEKTGETAFLIAAEKGDLELVKSLIEKGVDINQADKTGQTALMGAAYYDHFDIIKYLVEHEADVNKTMPVGYNALSISIIGKGTFQTVQYLLKNNAAIVSKGLFNRTAIWDAVAENKPGIVELLLQNGADPNYVAENGASLLIWATGKKYTEIESILKKYGAKK